ncbi:mechanosensitive ion channel family protein [Candidatus Liberibacter sp.]|uniref:mechanosensitive ion channel family protein n=1 Tax=Candidatus Liberibacter sp. TaxID=34022 RepID=UPI0015F62F4C|nr:mechanosensitive ion channel domain-containing protein [Candidatus Liberibacter sp.]MBA5723688.1 mechanosensitive ion channel family protein [Candidatus Liberibacter sp.]
MKTKTHKNSLVTVKIQIDDLKQEIADIISKYRVKLNEIRGKISELNDSSIYLKNLDDPVYINERRHLISERTQIIAILHEANALNDLAQNISSNIIEKRQKILEKVLLYRTKLNTTTIQHEFHIFKQEINSHLTIFANKIRVILEENFHNFLICIGISLVISYSLYLASNMLFPILRKRSNDSPSYADRLVFSCLSTFFSSLSVAIFLCSFLILLKGFDLLEENFIFIAKIIFNFHLILKAILSIFSPFSAKWRPINISNKSAKRISLYLFFLSIIDIFHRLFLNANWEFDSCVIFILISAIFIGIILIALSLLKPISTENYVSNKSTKYYKILAGIIGIILILSSLTGHIGLARFLSEQVLSSITILILTSIGYFGGQSIVQEGFFAKTFVGRLISTQFQLTENKIRKIGIAVGWSTKLSAIAIGLSSILQSSGFSLDDQKSILYKLLVTIHIGNVEISLLNISIGVAVFLLGLFFTKRIQLWVEKNIIPPDGTLDIGIRNSIKMGIVYIGYSIAAIVGMMVVGIDLSSFALVASALSLGIGFGLQNIVSNFVSGIILLVGRPFKVGDWITSGSAEGIVRYISVRATEIETFQKQSVIVPNSQLINATLGNWTLRNKIGRIDISISVLETADPQRVIEIMETTAEEIPLILRKPPPSIVFSNIQNRKLIFELHAYIPDILSATKTRNEIRLSLIKNLRKENLLP